MSSQTQNMSTDIERKGYNMQNFIWNRRVV